ncbi:hypothetical protein ARMGADRAFT_1089425 [Armillaria gallica]|uniref:Uncharacterized protein n=1 Tax=Armillaria gallica TaxID=47427 RepID=A0A2H3CVU0_ARMGA|nr:hypothetical protein ARMGADRAFT_1089425 [Armillaria gallica]
MDYRGLPGNEQFLPPFWVILIFWVFLSLYLHHTGVDQYGLQKWVCLHGTNKVEGGPHGDIYHKFGALHAGPRLTVNCLTDHHTWYNLQAYAKHLFGIDWTYHHNLALINQTSFLLNYMSDFIGGAQSYAEWINGDLYERTEETFGICTFPESLQLRLEMSPYKLDSSLKLNENNEWLRRRQGLALPVLPPTTPEARKYFFTNIREYLVVSSRDGKVNVDHESFARKWNQTADGRSRFYITTEILASYSKAWAKANNIRASQEIISDQLERITRSADVFAASHLSFPEFLSGKSLHTYPQAGVIELDDSNSLIVPSSLSINLSVSSVVPEIRPLTVTSSEPLNMLSASIPRLGIAPSSSMDIDPISMPPRVDDDSQMGSYFDVDLAPMGNTNDEASVAERMDIESSHSIPESDSTHRLVQAKWQKEDGSLLELTVYGGFAHVAAVQWRDAQV